jgi:trehalose/maltose hydrolase-like predicted phosphorylase
MLDLKVDGIRFQPGQGIFRGSSELDLRTGEASLSGIWATRAWTEPGPSTKVRISIRLLMPRTINHGGFFELSVEGDGCQIEASIGWQGKHLKDLPMAWRCEGNDFLGDGMTGTRQRPVRLGSRLDLQTGNLCSTTCDKGDAKWKVEGSGGKLVLAMSATLHGGMESGDPEAARRADLKRICEGRADGSLRKANEAEWKAIWSRGYDVMTLPLEYRRITLAQQYYLLTASDTSPWPTGPQGVAGNNWKGNPFWDADLYTFRALLPLWPEFAESILASRLTQLPEGRKNAQEEGHKGALINLTDENGTFAGNPHYRQEVHLGAWPAFAAWDYWRASHDQAWLRRYWPLLQETARFFGSRSTVDPDGSWHLRGVIPPDEYVHEHGNRLCDDSVATNLVARAILRAADEAAKILGEEADPLWKIAAERLHILKPDPEGLIPEFEGYAGETVKQADVILAFYPLDFALPEKLVRKNLAYYREHWDSFGPIMTGQIDACIQMRLGDREEGLRFLFDNYVRNLRGPFLIATEGPHNNVVGFNTACGGLLQALIYGYTPYRQPGDALSLIPRLGPL